MEDKWREGWEAFFDSVAKRVRAVEQPEQFAHYFAGELVEWDGVLYAKDLDDLAPAVCIDMSADRMDIGDGRIAEFAGLRPRSTISYRN